MRGKAGPRRRPQPVPLLFGLIFGKVELLRLLVFGTPEPQMVLADLAGVAVLVGVVALVARGAATSPALWALNVVLSVLLTAVYVYADRYQTLPTFTALREADGGDGVRGALGSLLDVRLLLLYADLVAAPFIGMRMHGDGWAPPRPWVGRARLRGVGAVAIAGVVVTGVALVSAAGIRNEQYRAEQVGVLGYQADALLRALKPRDDLDLAAAYDRVAKLKERDHVSVTDPGNAAGFGVAEGKNLLLVQMGALQQLVVGQWLDGQEITPHLNALVGSSHSFPRHVQQVGKGGAIDAQVIANTSLCPAGDVATSTAYGDRLLPGLPALLRERGYVAEPFAVGRERSPAADDLLAGLGFTVTPPEQPRAPGPAGLSAFYEHTLQRLTEIAATGKPFYAHLVTDPEAAAAGDAEGTLLRLPARLAGTEAGAYLQAQRAADRALGTLVRGLKESGLWSDTVLVVYGDQGGLRDGAAADVRAWRTGYRSWHRFNTPLLIRVPGQGGARHEGVAGQLDILPTVANLLGVSLAKERFVAFGVDLLNTGEHTVALRFHAPTGTFLDDRVLFQPGRGFADGTVTGLDALDGEGEEERLDVADLDAEEVGDLEGEYRYALDLMDLCDTYVASLPRR
ncbi:sulfatase-like hydrolase/transferase [Nocardioides sp. zg-ZUI104]|uniref:LTA synthase family protein n=1 Tax=Nocardioides faecalis TaxID=2803858 RepID=UPI001BCF3FFA|nr:sulfatase-like hydrolase/transferase [Nocardioides faecalis]MBS4753005.1 sulfatase-like hydrolase/transferase [Nocardioides faecalis]